MNSNNHHLISRKLSPILVLAVSNPYKPSKHPKYSEICFLGSPVSYLASHYYYYLFFLFLKFAASCGNSQPVHVVGGIDNQTTRTNRQCLYHRFPFWHMLLAEELVISWIFSLVIKAEIWRSCTHTWWKRVWQWSILTRCCATSAKPYASSTCLR